MGPILATCLLLAAQTYSVPPEIMFGIYKVEAGQVGQMVGPNKNGGYDLGPMQINTLWIPELARIWGVDQRTAAKWVGGDECTNAGVAAWIIRRNYDETGDMGKAISYYHSRTPHLGEAYKKRVVTKMLENGWAKVKGG